MNEPDLPNEEPELDLEDDKPLVCPLRRPGDDDEICEACQ